jgi:lysophospholipase L1-like esterase
VLKRALLLALLAVPAAAGAQSIVAFGDSITLGEGDACNTTDPAAQCGYPGRLQRLLRAAGEPDALVRNLGVSGEETAEGMVRITQVLRETDDLLLLMEGTNDVGKVSLDTILFNLREIARKAAARGVPTVFATVVPRNPGAKHDPDNRVTERLNWGIRELADSFAGRPLADPYEEFLQVPDRFSTLYAPRDVVGHPNAAGYDVIAATFHDVLRGVDSVPPVPWLVEPRDGIEGVPASQHLRIRLFDFGAGIDATGTTLLLGGVPVNTVVTPIGNGVELTHQPAGPLAGVIVLGYRSRDLASPANSVERQASRSVVFGTIFLRGDVDQSGRVDGLDLVRLARAFGTRAGGVRFDVAVDLDRDGEVDGADLAILATDFGKSSF